MTASALAASLDRIGQIQAHLPGPASFLLALVATGATLIRWLWPVTRHITVLAHEGAHATVGSALGREITGIKFKLNADGATEHSTGGQLSTFAIKLVGYLGPSAFGIGAAELIRIGHIVAVLWIGLAGLLAILMILRWSFGIVTVAIATLLLFGVAGFASVSVQVLTAYAIAWFLLASSIRGITRRRSGSQDSEDLRGLTRIPHGFWYRIWLVGSVGSLVFGATLLV